MRILELQEYTKEHGFDSLEFTFNNLVGREINGKWLDAYMGIFRFDGMEENTMMTVTAFRKEFGDELFDFTPKEAEPKEQAEGLTQQ